LYQRYGASTLGFFRNKVRSASLAADLNQNLYLRLSRSLDNFRGECSWRTWLFSIARVVLADARRERWRHLADREVVLDVDAISVELRVELNADEEARRLLLRHRLVRCLRRLDELARAVVVEHYFHGVTLRELTERLSLLNASGSRAVLIAAQRKLRRCMEEGSGQ
jgi:RNA polymerase sigma-70 factor (ECF subfamily)